MRYDQGKELTLTGAEWADWDQRGRLVFAAAGKVFALDADAIGQAPPKELADLNGNWLKPSPRLIWPKPGEGFVWGG